MSFKIETDVQGAEFIAGDVAQFGGRDRRTCLELRQIVYDVWGHAYTVDPQKHALARLAPHEADMVRFFEAERGRADPDIFSGDPPAS